MKKRYVESVRFKGEISRKSYLADLSVVKFLKKARELDFSNSVTFLTGENGSGKSTLIEAIAVCAGFNAEGGGKNFTFSTANTVSELSEHITITKTAYPRDGFFLRAESFYNLATDIDNMDDMSLIQAYGGASLHEQSHGESFLLVIRNRFWGNGLYILDEPEAALSPVSQMALLSLINDLVNKNSQFIIATHSPILLAYPEAQIYEIFSDGIEKNAYNNCENVKLYRQFLESPQRMMKHLFAEEHF